MYTCRPRDASRCRDLRRDGAGRWHCGGRLHSYGNESARIRQEAYGGTPVPTYEGRPDDPANLAVKGKATATSCIEGSPASNVLDGYSRTLPKGESRAWISDPKTKLPQSVNVEFSAPEKIAEVRIVFDSDFYINPKWIKHVVPSTLAKEYTLEVLGEDGKWEKVADVKDSAKRMAVHTFPARMVKALKVTVSGTWGDPSARVFEIQCYR